MYEFILCGGVCGYDGSWWSGSFGVLDECVDSGVWSCEFFVVYFGVYIFEVNLLD